MSNQDNKEKLAKLAYSFFISRCIFTAAELGIADILHKSPKTSAEIAAQLKTDPESTERLMRGLVAFKIFSRDAQHRFHNTDLSEYLRSDSPESMRDMIMIEDPTRWNAYGELLYSVKTGKPSFDKVNNEPIFDYVAIRPELSERLAKGLKGWAKDEETVLAGAYDYDNFSTIIDVGGNTGSLLAKILQKNPKTHGILFDQPQMVNQSELPINTIPADRRKIIGGDFFKSVPEGGDLYILKRVIHDWSDAKSEIILKNIHKVLPKHGKVLIMEAVIDENNPNEMIYAVDLMIMCLLDGKERTKEEFDKIAKASGFVINRIIPTKSIMSIIELVKK